MSADTLYNESNIFNLGGELPVKRLGFGAMRLTGEGVWGDPEDREEAKRVLQRAVELGVNFIDTADAYGPNTNEELIAEALYPYPPDLVIATKGGRERSGPDEWIPNARPEHLREALEGSLRRLKLERIDLYQIHWPDPAVPFTESVGALVDMQQEGLIRLIGLSNVSLAQLEEARSLTDIATVQNRFNLYDQASREILKVCEQLDIGFIPYAPLVAGKLPQDPLEEVARVHQATPAQVALAWLLQRSPVVLPIPGTSRVTHLEENVAASTLVLSREELERLDL
jgi:aryl-alcohol dehydrogenase-like predicted oxidoreductase